MNEVKHRKERTERKRPLGDVNRLAMAMPPSPPPAETPVKRPSRACSSRRMPYNTPSPPAPRSPSFKGSKMKVEQGSKGKVEQGSRGKLEQSRIARIEQLPPRPSGNRTVAKAISLVLSSSLSPAQKDRLELRGMWELAAIINFFSVFRPILNLVHPWPEFTMDELESALLTPNPTLDTIHVTLLKGVPPAARVPLRGDTWPTVLSKKFKDWWWRVAGGPCPLIASQGAEIAAYREFDAPTRVRILLALCEMRVDQEDARNFIDDAVKNGRAISALRKERSGCGAEGTTFWLEDDQIMGQRLYREGQSTLKSRAKGWVKGRNVPPPSPGNWETVATNLEEFQEVSQKLTDSHNRMESAMGKKIFQGIMPQLEEIQKKKERMIKKQQREAVLLNSLLQGNGLAAGRSRRERKPVTYTFDEFDRSISEAIKFTKKNPETSFRRDLRYMNGVNGVPGDLELGQFGKDRNGNAAHGQEGYANGVGSSRRSLRSSHLHLGPEAEGEAGVEAQGVGLGAEPHFGEAEGFSDDDIEGEAVYDDDYIAAKQRRESYSSERGEAFRGDDQDDADFDGEEERIAEDSDDYEEFERGDSDGGSEERGRKRQRRGPKVRLVNDLTREGELRHARHASGQAGNSEDDGSDFGGRHVPQRRRKVEGARGGRSTGLEGNVVEGPEVGFEEAPSESDQASGYSSERQNGKEPGLFEDVRKNGHASQVEDDGQSADHSEEHSVQHSARTGSAGEQEEAGSVDFDEDEDMGHEVESSKGGGKRRHLLDLNEVATGARGNSPLSDNEESEYSGDEREDANGAEAG